MRWYSSSSINDCWVPYGTKNRRRDRMLKTVRRNAHGGTPLQNSCMHSQASADKVVDPTARLINVRSSCKGVVQSTRSKELRMATLAC
jgi:hypothetical protein